MPAMEGSYLVATGVVLLTVLMTWFNKWWYEPKLDNRYQPLPPGNLGWPVLGNMLSFILAFKSQNPDAFISGFTSRYGKSGLYKAFMFREPTILATTPETCKHVLCSKQFEIGWPARIHKLFGPKTLATVFGDEHAQLVKLTQPALFSASAVQHQMHRMEANAKKMISEWASQDKILLAEEARTFTLRVAHDVLLGEDSGVDIQHFQDLFGTLLCGYRAWPVDFPGTTFNRAVKAHTKLAEIIQKIVQKRKCSNSMGADTLSLFVRSTDEFGNRLPDFQIVNLILGFLSGGQSPSAILITWVCIMLNKYPEIYEKVKVEQDIIARQKSDGELLSSKDTSSMPYLLRVIKETLRVVNISPFGFRKALEDVELNGYTIPKGWTVEIWARQVHMDPANFKNPHVFDPDRWLDKKNEPLLSAFGGGRRKCPGRNLAMVQTSIFVHHMVTKYKMEPLNPNYQTAFLPHPKPLDSYPMKISSL